jgi:predicted O-methyltransferase YrrM
MTASFALRELLKLTHGLPGDVAECGVYRGCSSYLMAKELARHAPDKRLHLFDSFAGLSQPGPLDGSHWRAGALACTLPDVRANLAEYERLIVIHAGWIPDCFSEVVDRSFCFVHIDVDLYEPTLASLEFFGSRMVPGGIIVCDDYGFETCPGARRAGDEFAAARAIPVVHLPTGQGILFPGYPRG